MAVAAVLDASMETNWADSYGVATCLVVHSTVQEYYMMRLFLQMPRFSCSTGSGIEAVWEIVCSLPDSVVASAPPRDTFAAGRRRPATAMDEPSQLHPRAVSHGTRFAARAGRPSTRLGRSRPVPLALLACSAVSSAYARAGEASSAAAYTTRAGSQVANGKSMSRAELNWTGYV